MDSMAASRLHDLGPLLFSIVKCVQKGVLDFWDRVKNVVTSIVARLSRLVAPEPRPFPSALTTWISILAFCAYAGLLVATSIYHTSKMRVILSATASVSVFVILILVVRDCRKYTGGGK